MEDKILTIEEVAQAVKVSLKTVYRWISNGILPATKIGSKTYRVFESDLVKFLRQNMINSSRK